MIQVTSGLFLVASQYLLFTKGFVNYYYLSLQLLTYFLITQGILALKFTPNKKKSTPTHQLFQVLSIVSYIISNYLNDKPLNSSYPDYSKTILYSMIGAAVAANLNMYVLSTFMKDTKLAWKGHGFFGYLVYVAVSINTILGLEANFGLTQSFLGWFVGATWAVSLALTVNPFSGAVKSKSK
ncbi:hypothetical protein K502DRAFT_330699 [Neoconidiobolus thromboides FSU 785]|nr:hypothetical protein K502DRAFT_330699 [Neoconidiobolus thromboides FSU 785]